MNVSPTTAVASTSPGVTAASGECDVIEQVVDQINEHIAGLDTAATRVVGSRYLNSGVKRVLDLLSSGTALLLLGIFAFPFIAILIKLDSPGPVLYRQRRYGRNGQVFWCFKFRTMTHCPESQIFVQAQKHDARVTKVGQRLRSSNLDELPQLLNVLKGDMSLIGPRPHPVELDDKFSYWIPNLMNRYSAKPGLSGLAQVSGQRGVTSNPREMHNRLRFDYLYIQKASVALDLKIVALTIIKMLRGDEKAF
jgi:putative colanic acid biosysnthesis UDP-glucose lipid carrier transferase